MDGAEHVGGGDKWLGKFGPALYLGVGRRGHGRRWALLPGLEFLPPDEPSSAWLFAVPPHCWRWDPDPRQITIPLMVAEGRGAVVGWLWHEKQAGMPRIYFDTPNRREGQDNTAMAIRLAQAETEVYLYCRPGGQVLDAVDEWVGRYGLPPMPETERTFEEELRWMKRAVGKQRSNLAAQLDGLVRAARNAVASQKADGSWRYGGPDAKVREWLEGKVAGALEHARKEVGDSQAFTLDAYGRAGDTAIGQCVFFNRLELLARAALLTGDQELVDATLRGLAYCDANFQRPEGAETWEIPLHAPDLLAAAHAVAPYLDAWEITGEQRDLERAIYWARTGLPFIYLWSAPEREHMSYASIPVFGASYFVAPWFGRSVQFIGMHYARAIWRLAEADPSRPWRRIAEGITRRCMTMQVFADHKDPAKRFHYPDSWGHVDDTHTGPDIHPGDIIANCRMILGWSADEDHAVMSTKAGRLHVSVEGRMAEARMGPDGRVLELRVATSVGNPEVLIGGPGAGKVRRVSVDEEGLVRLERTVAGVLVGRLRAREGGGTVCVRIELEG